jgi:hypothetical protein
MKDGRVDSDSKKPKEEPVKKAKRALGRRMKKAVKAAKESK